VRIPEQPELAAHHPASGTRKFAVNTQTIW
jgi:hypothetical protein